MRQNEARYIEARKRWQINVQKNGIRRTFVSSLKGRKGKIDCEQKADKWLERFSETVRFGSAWEMFMEDYRPTVASTTYQNTVSILKNAIEPVIPSKKKLEEVTLYDWQRVVDVYAKDHKKASCQGVISRITSFAAYARRRNWAHFDVLEGDLVIPDTAGAPSVKKAIDNELFGRLLDANYDSFGWYVHAVQFIVLTGLRRGEAAGLTWEHVNIKERYIDVVEAINRHNVKTDGKTINAQRRVPLQSAAIEILDRQRAHLARAGVLSNYVFCKADGTPAHTPTISAQYLKWVRRQGVETTLHELRHTFVSVCFGEMQLEQLKKSVGHSGGMDTGKVYAHDVKGRSREIARAVEQAFGKFIVGDNAEDVDQAEHA